MGHAKAERENQEKALDCFEKAFAPYWRVNGRLPSRDSIIHKLEKFADPLAERPLAIVGFLAGELARRLKDYDKARRYFEEVVSLPFLHQFTSLYQHIYATYRQMKKTLGEKV